MFLNPYRLSWFLGYPKPDQVLNAQDKQTFDPKEKIGTFRFRGSYGSVCGRTGGRTRRCGGHREDARAQSAVVLTVPSCRPTHHTSYHARLAGRFLFPSFPYLPPDFLPSLDGPAGDPASQLSPEPAPFPSSPPIGHFHSCPSLRPTTLPLFPLPRAAVLRFGYRSLSLSPLGHDVHSFSPLPLFTPPLFRGPWTSDLR